MRFLSESVGFLPENGRFSLRIDGESGGEMRVDFAVSITVDAVYKPFFN